MTAEKFTAEAIRLKPHHKWNPNDTWVVFRRLNGINFAKGKACKIALALLFFAASACFAEANPAVDSLKAEVGEIKSSVDSLSRKFISDNFISVKAAKETQNLYNTSFSNMQTSFNTFVAAVCGIITLLALISVYLNFKISDKLKEDINREIVKTNEKIAESENKFKEEIKAQSENQKTDFENLKKEINVIKTEAKEDIKNQKITLKLTSDDIFKEIRDVYFSFALNYLYFGEKNKPDISMHFMNLGKYFEICTTHNIELNNDINFLYYENIESFIDKDYKEIPHDYFLYCFEKFKQYCHKNNNEKHIECVEKIWKKLCDKFGEQNILDEIKKYKKCILDDRLDIYLNRGVCSDFKTLGDK